MSIKIIELYVSDKRFDKWGFCSDLVLQYSNYKNDDNFEYFNKILEYHLSLYFEECDRRPEQILARLENIIEEILTLHTIGIIKKDKYLELRDEAIRWIDRFARFDGV